MAEMTDGGDDHGQTVFVGGRHAFFIPNASAGLNNGGDAHLRRLIDRVAKGKETVGRHHQGTDLFGAEGRNLKLHLRHFERIDAGHLPRADAGRRAAPG